MGVSDFFDFQDISFLCVFDTDFSILVGIQRPPHSLSLSTSFSTLRFFNLNHRRHCSSSKVEEYNEHWVPFYLLCTPCHLNYTLVAKTETIEEDSRYGRVTRAGLESFHCLMVSETNHNLVRFARSSIDHDATVFKVSSRQGNL